MKAVILRKPNVETELLPRRVKALLDVGSVVAANDRCYAVSDTGELWAWRIDGWSHSSPLGHGEQKDCAVPKPIKSLRGVEVDAVAAGHSHTLAVADDGSVYVWGRGLAVQRAALGLGCSCSRGKSSRGCVWPSGSDDGAASCQHGCMGHGCDRGDGAAGALQVQLSQLQTR
jgi:hypothetical protein